MLDLTQARRPPRRPIVIAPTIALGRRALFDAGVDGDDPRAYCMILTPLSAPLSYVIGCRPATNDVINVLGDVEPSLHLRATLDVLERKGFDVTTPTEVIA